MLPRFDRLEHVHIVGVCGTLMGAFAAFLRRRGIKVTGSDQNVYPPMSDVLASAGVTLYSGYRAENLMASGSKPDLVVIGNVVRSDNPEAVAAMNGGYAYTSLPEAMEKLLLLNTRNIVVAGTHGKTTTSSLMAFVLHRLGKKGNFFIGGVPQDLPFSFHVESLEAGTPFVLEGDEYDTAFWDKVPKFNHYLPDDVIFTSMEYDHADIYPDFASVQRAFTGLLTRIRAKGRLILCVDDPQVAKMAVHAEVPVITYSSGSTSSGIEADFRLGSIRGLADGIMEFDILAKGSSAVLETLRLKIPGKHNALNALAVWIESRELGLDLSQVREALAQFKGVKRRQEERGEVNGVLVLDDFAHHPTAVRETLQALRLKYPKRRIIAVFEPRSATSRRKVFQKDYGLAFRQADATFIAQPYDTSRIPAADQFSSEQLVSDLTGVGHPAQLMPSVEEGVAQVTRFARPGDLVAVLSNGGFGGFIPRLLEGLRGTSG
ncbi:MAG: UDP-N-acetylmuramate:L-alanyl-gamma-D-glutamyl-meso-diaminopimelate ligase [Bdellovibrionales bacterium]|nr:UDP-N-acetylmuramate:L-alanyl-gamma-D-glutamyl-meso-diaminopimelate ligase [Bdellovibrionales bacterium]